MHQSFSAVVEHGESIPYAEAIKACEKINESTNPREKLNCVQEMFNMIKTSVVDHYHGKVELEAMDDILPIFIYVVSQSNFTHICSEVNFLKDYIKVLDDGYELEDRMLTNIEVAVDYILGEWELSNPKKEVAPDQA